MKNQVYILKKSGRSIALPAPTKSELADLLRKAKRKDKRRSKNRFELLNLIDNDTQMV